LRLSSSLLRWLLGSRTQPPARGRERHAEAFPARSFGSCSLGLSVRGETESGTAKPAQSAAVETVTPPTGVELAMSLDAALLGG